jgi:hypothetical protein
VYACGQNFKQNLEAKLYLTIKDTILGFSGFKKSMKNPEKKKNRTFLMLGMCAYVTIIKN